MRILSFGSRGNDSFWKLHRQWDKGQVYNILLDGCMDFTIGKGLNVYSFFLVYPSSVISNSFLL